jgi:anti-sigma factor RsiW
MNHRHLLPNEIDLLVDGEAGFGVAPLRAHILECDDCRRRLEEERVVVDALEALPHFAPDSRLADRVMAQVPVFVPAHVAARDTVRRWLPQSVAARVAAVAVAGSMAATLTLGMIWLALQGDAVAFITGLLGDRLRMAVVGSARDVTVALLGDSALAALQGLGAIGASLLFLAFLLGAVGTIAGIRRLAVTGRRA